MEHLKYFFYFFIIFIFSESFSFPLQDSHINQISASSQPMRAFFPHFINSRYRRQEGGNAGGIGETLMNAIKDGIAASSAFSSPTMFIGGFSVMMQPMPNGTEFSGQLMQMAPNYLNLLAGAG